MLLASYRKDKSGNDGWVSTEYGVRDSKSLFWDELPKEEQHNAIFKVLLRNFMVVDKKRLELERIKDSMMNKKLPTSNVETRKNWRFLNYQNMKDLAKCEQNFADFHAGNVDHLFVPIYVFSETAVMAIFRFLKISFIKVAHLQQSLLSNSISFNFLIDILLY